MKAPTFWYEEHSQLSNLLEPLSLFYRAGAWVHRRMTKPSAANKPVICVGNIVTGGAGKTPTALCLATVLKNRGYNPVFVTRGYGGREKGPLKVDVSVHTAMDVGDEALLLARVAPTWIGHDRVAALKQAEQFGSHIILDDGLQNPSLKFDRAILVIDGPVGLGNGRILPAGPLRQTIGEVEKQLSAVIIVGEDTHSLASRFEVPVFHASLETVLPVDFPLAQNFLAFAGIGRPEKFYETCRRAGLSLTHTENFADHHYYSERELRRLKKLSEQKESRLITTEKDWVRLSQEWKNHILYLPAHLIFNDLESVTRLLVG